MLDRKEGFEVFVRPYDSLDKYQHYTAPSTSDYFAHGRNERFIEAVTGERFSVEVIRHPIARWRKRTTAVQVICRVDDIFETSQYLKKETHGAKKEHEALTATFNTFIHGTAEGTKIAALQFGEVRTVDDPTYLSKEEEDDEIKARGKIEVFIKHGWVSSHQVTRRQKILDASILPDGCQPEQTTKTVSSGAGKSHFSKPIVLRDFTPGEWSWSFRSNDEADDAVEDTIKFTIYYTTRMFMEVQKIIPVIHYPNTEAEAILIDENAPSPPASSDTPIPPRPPPTEEVSFVSTRRASKYHEVIKIESDEDDDDEDEEDDDADADNEYEPVDSEFDRFNGHDRSSNSDYRNEDNDIPDTFCHSPLQEDRMNAEPDNRNQYAMSGGLGNRTTVDPGSPERQNEEEQLAEQAAPSIKTEGSPEPTTPAIKTEPGDNEVTALREQTGDEHYSDEDLYGTSVQGDCKPELDEKGNILLTPERSSDGRESAARDVDIHRAESRAARAPDRMTKRSAFQARSTGKRRRSTVDVRDAEMELEDIMLARREIAIKRKLRAARSEE